MMSRFGFYSFCQIWNPFRARVWGRKHTSCKEKRAPRVNMWLVQVYFPFEKMTTESNGNCIEQWSVSERKTHLSFVQFCMVVRDFNVYQLSFGPFWNTGDSPLTSYITIMVSIYFTLFIALLLMFLKHIALQELQHITLWCFRIQYEMCLEK
jgi:hypothetical protein